MVAAAAGEGRDSAVGRRGSVGVGGLAGGCEHVTRRQERPDGRLVIEGGDRVVVDRRRVERGLGVDHGPRRVAFDVAQIEGDVGCLVPDSGRFLAESDLWIC